MECEGKETSFLTFSSWPDLVQINLLERLSFTDTLNLRLVSREWCTGVDYVRRVWSVHKPTWFLRNDNLQEYLENSPSEEVLAPEENPDPHSNSFLALIVKWITNFLTFLFPTATEWRATLQFDRLHIGEGNTLAVIKPLLTSNATEIQSLTLHGTSFSQKSMFENFDTIIIDELCFQNCKEFKIRVNRGFYLESRKKPDLRLKQHLKNLSKFLNKATFPQLCKLHLEFYTLELERYFGRPLDADGTIELADLWSSSLAKFLQSHGHQVEAFSIGCNYENFKFIFPLLKFLPNIKELEFQVTSETRQSISAPPDLLTRWKEASLGLKKLSHVTCEVFNQWFPAFDADLLESLLATNGTVLESLIVRQQMFNIAWFNSCFCPKLRYVELNLHDETFENYQNSSSSSVFDSVCTLKITMTILNEDAGYWRITTWITDTFPNLRKFFLTIFTYATQYQIDTCFASYLINQLDKLILLEVHYPSGGVPSQSYLEDFCANSQGQYFFKAYKQVADQLNYSNEGFQIQIKRTQ